MKNKPNFFKYSKVSIQYLCTLIFNIKHQINVQYYYNSALKCNNNYTGQKYLTRKDGNFIFSLPLGS